MLNFLEMMYSCSVHFSIMLTFNFQHSSSFEFGGIILDLPFELGIPVGCTKHTLFLSCCEIWYEMSMSCYHLVPSYAENPDDTLLKNEMQHSSMIKFLPRPYVNFIAKPYTYAACLLHWALSNSWTLCEMLFILLWSRFTCTHHICKFLHWELATTCLSFHPINAAC